MKPHPSSNESENTFTSPDLPNQKKYVKFMSRESEIDDRSSLLEKYRILAEESTG